MNESSSRRCRSQFHRKRGLHPPRHPSGHIHGMAYYVTATAPLEEKRDMYLEAIEEPLDGIGHLTRQVVRLEELLVAIPHDEKSIRV